MCEHRSRDIGCPYKPTHGKSHIQVLKRLSIDVLPANAIKVTHVKDLVEDEMNTVSGSVLSLLAKAFSELPPLVAAAAEEAREEGMNIVAVIDQADHPDKDDLVKRTKTPQAKQVRAHWKDIQAKWRIYNDIRDQIVERFPSDSEAAIKQSGQDSASVSQGYKELGAAVASCLVMQALYGKADDDAARDKKILSAMPTIEQVMTASAAELPQKLDMLLKATLAEMST